MRDTASPPEYAVAAAGGPSKLFLVLSRILGAALGLFYGVMLIFNFTDAGDLAPLMIFFLFLAASGAALLVWRESFPISNRWKYLAAAVGAVVLLLAQVRFAKAIYGHIAYDFNTLYAAARAMAQEGTLGGHERYFAKFPNNLLLTLFFAAVIKLAAALGISNFMAVLTVCSLAAVDLAFLLTLLCARKIGPKAPRTVMLFGVPFILFYYGIVNPYSDTFGMPVPVLLLTLYLYMPKKEPAALAVAALMGAVTAVGFKIKPQTVIIAIAVGMVEFFFQKLDRRRLLHLGRRALCFLLALILAGAGINGMTRLATKNVISDRMMEENEVPFTHFLMMGLNPDTIGKWNADDYNATLSFDKKSERISYNLSAAAKRVQDMGVLGLGKFMVKKARANFHSVNMDHWILSPFRSGDPLSTAIQQVFCQGGSSFKVYLQFQEALWIIMLALWLLPLLLRTGSCRDRLGAVLRLTVMGYTLFQLLFESGPRYKYHLFPIFILLSVWGLQLLPQGLKDTMESLKRRFPQRGPRKEEGRA